MVLKSARKADGIWRAELMGKAAQMDSTQPESQVAFYLFPTCVACVKEPLEIRNMSLSDFLNKVDENDIETWTKEAYELNPQWKEGWKLLAEMSEEQSKLTGTPSSGSTEPMEVMPVSQEISPVLMN